MVRQTILKSVDNGKTVVRLADDRAYDSTGCVEGPAGRRRRISGRLTTLTLDDSTLVTPADSTYGVLWVKEDTPSYERTKDEALPPPPPAAEQVTATVWNKILEYASQRPLLELHLIASNPSVGANLMGLVVPLGADSITVSVTVSGAVKDGGAVNFAANEIKLTHPTKPLSIAQTLFSALVDGAGYEADLTLHFGAAGRTGLESRLQALAENLPEGVSPRAFFDKPVVGAK